MQEDVGLQSATDGEFRRASWHMDFIYQLGGIQGADHLSVKFHSDEGDIEFTPLAASGRRAHLAPEPIFAEDVPSSCSETTSRRRRPKLTIPSPSMVHYRGGRGGDRRGRLPGPRPVLERPHRRLRRPGAGAIGELGCTYLQFDDTSLAYLNDPSQREHVRSIGGDAEHQHETYIRHINEALAGRPEGHGRHHAHVPRQLPLVVGRRGRLRLRRRGAVRRARGRRLLHGVGRRALGRLRAAALRAGGQGRRARPRHDQARRAREQGPAQAAHRGGVAVRGRRPAVPVAAVRLLLDRRGQRAHRGAAGRQACGSSSRSPRRSGAERLPLRRGSARRSAATAARWRACGLDLAATSCASCWRAPDLDPARSTTCCSATPTAPARTTATSRGWPCCWPGLPTSRDRSDGQPPVAAPRWTPRCRPRARSRPATPPSSWSAASSR